MIIGVHGALDVQIEVNGGNEVVLGVSTTIVCRYLKSASDTLIRIAFTYGPPNVNFRSNIADFYLYSDDPNPRYYDPFMPPAYTITIDERDEGSFGTIELIIQSVSVDDARRYWCDVSTLDVGYTGYADTTLTVIGKLQWCVYIF